ncbi:MAG TPA: serine/threonine-protein kinase [Tepidisphaeraceae bacterium]
MTGAIPDGGGAAAAAAAGMRGYRYKHGDRPLDGYTIQRAAGRGGFGEVYYAVSDGGREVALKIVQAYEQVELRGISQCMNLKSPHLVSVFDVRYADDGQPVVIMEYVAGPSLREILDESPSGLGTQKAAFFLREIGKGLTYLHDCGIVHRDLKPANIFYENGYVKIGDYGLSKMISASHRSGQTVTVGTLHYMAPEVGAGRYDRGIDIYALGALLFEMITGQPPFFGMSPAEVLMKHVSAQVDVSNVEEPFASVIRKALAKDPAQRYQTVQEMIEAVFGSQHVQQSVSCFSPDSLTLVAGRVAGHAGIRPGGPAVPRSLSSRAYEVGGRGGDEKDWGAGVVDRVSGRARRAARRFASLGHRLANRAARLAGRGGAGAGLGGMQTLPYPAPQVEPVPGPVLAVDELSRWHRVLLMGIATVALGVAAGAFADGHNPPISAWFTMLGILGATLSITWASRHVLPALRGESWFMRHLAAGGLAGAAVIAVALPAWVPALSPHIGRRSFHVGETLASICLALLVVDWSKRTRATRRERVSLGDLISAGIAAVVVGMAMDAAVEVVIGVMCGTSLGVQILSAWTPRVRRDVQGAAVKSQFDDIRKTLTLPARGQSPDPLASPGVPGEGAETASVATPLGGGRHVDMATIYSVARRSVVAGKTVVLWPFRLVFKILAGVLLLASLLLAVAVAFDVPGLLASGRIDPRLPEHIRQGMGIENWALAMRSIGLVGLFLLGSLAVTLLMWFRRPQGGVHMLRVVAGAAMLIWAPFILASYGIDWTVTEVHLRPIGRDFWQPFVQQVTPHLLIRAAVVQVAGILLLLWPARQARRHEVASKQVNGTQEAPAATT